MGTRCTLLLRNRGAGSKYTDVKKIGRGCLRGLREAFFWSIPRIFHSMQTLPLFPRADMRTRCTCICRYTR